MGPGLHVTAISAPPILRPLHLMKNTLGFLNLNLNLQEMKDKLGFVHIALENYIFSVYGGEASGA